MGAASAACSSVSVSTRGAGRTLSLTLKASPRLPLPLLRRGLQKRKRRPSHLPPSHICTTPHLPQSRPLSPLSNSPFTYLYRTSHSPSPITPRGRSHTAAPRRARPRPRPPPRGERTLPCPSLCTAGVLYGEGVGLVGVDGRVLVWGREEDAGEGGNSGGRGCGQTRIGPTCARGGSQAVSQPGPQRR